VTLHTPRADTTERVARLLAFTEVEDVTIEEPPVEEIISLVFENSEELHLTG